MNRGLFLVGPSQASKAVNRRLSCSPMRTTCFTSKLWMRLEPANRARLLLFPPKVTKRTLKLSFIVHKYVVIFFSPACNDFQAQGSTCWKPQLTLLWSFQRTRPHCTSLRTHLKTHHLKTDSEFNQFLSTLWSPFNEYVRIGVCCDF